MTASLIAFPRRLEAPRGALRFTSAERQSVLATGYMPGLCASIEADDAGDEWAWIGAAADEFHTLDGVCIGVRSGGFEVSVGCDEVLGMFASIGTAVTAARRDMMRRMGTVDVEAGEAA